ncbi:MAG: LacI family DNA-binding transcriptional regulator [Austwickia sp.]|nr:LacI family DNA-binding transcriptional regulator [Austwickia sp.]
MSTQKKATIYSVASEAGVSIATVSRVLGTRGRVAPTTRRRVEEAAARLNYAPLASARSLASKRHAALGLVVHADAAPEIITGFTAQATLREDAVMLVVADAGPHGLRHCRPARGSPAWRAALMVWPSSPNPTCPPI